MRKIFIMLSLLVSIAFIGCTNKKEQNKKILTVTIEPQRYFTEQIAGDKFSVVSMVPKGSSPESYDPIPSQLVSLDKSEAYFRIGYIGFELTWFERLKENAPHMLVFDTSAGINLILDSHHHHHGDNEGSNHSLKGIDPHIWNSPINVQIIANNTCKALCSLDKANEIYYIQRCNKLKQEIKNLDDTLKVILKNADKSFMIYHPALSYFARDYGLHQICIEEEGKEPSPAHLKELIQTCKKEGVRVIFVQQEFDKNNAELIAKETGTKIVSINPLSYDWKGEMIHIAQALKR
ncbi:metal ABC transporter solute-binding protein, Zn/Mn family [uncultured Bacteroides sp.]|uniref:metal ABC transporter solute-binding protein, Zn/Mn family n=1 Tax=uncultured Bacteroides sp. TaxID=162156 RepID=UPI002AAB7643|nr:zinc ABC transporter substrate-binding protein [uncultured Bacteroides sp.]